MGKDEASKDSKRQQEATKRGQAASQAVGGRRKGASHAATTKRTGRGRHAGMD